MNRKQKKSKAERRVRITNAHQAAEAADAEQSPRQPRKKFSKKRAKWLSQFLTPAEEAIKPGTPVILFVRVSTQNQADNGNLAIQESILREEVERLGGEVAGTVRYVGSAIYSKNPSIAEQWTRAAKLAQARGAAALALSDDRYVRSAEHQATSGRQRGRLADQDEVAAMAEHFGDTTLAVVLPIGITQAGVDAERGRLYPKARGNVGGRGNKNTRRMKKRDAESLRPRVLELKREGKSYGEIKELTGISRSTAYHWVVNY